MDNSLLAVRDINHTYIVVGDIGVKITYDMGGSMALLGEAVVIFDSDGNIKSVAF